MTSTQLYSMTREGGSHTCTIPATLVVGRSNRNTRVNNPISYPCDLRICAIVIVTVAIDVHGWAPSRPRVVVVKQQCRLTSLFVENSISERGHSSH